jgi:DNA polymerase III epsilon subunit-like protein
MVQGSPRISDIFPKFLSFVQELPLLAHNAIFDIGFLLPAFHELQISLPTNEVYDSCLLSRYFFKHEGKDLDKRPASNKLGELAKFFEIRQLSHHRAKEDAEVCLAIFLSLINLINQNNKREQIIKNAFLFSLDSFQNSEKFDLPDRLSILLNPMAEGQIVEIIYSGGNHRNTFRPIRPIGLVPMPHTFVLRAKCLLTNMIKSFVVKRIKKVKILTPSAQREWIERSNSQGAK